MPSGSVIPRSLREGPPSISSTPGAYDDPEASFTDETKHDKSQSAINSMERVPKVPLASEDTRLSRSRTHRTHEALKKKGDAFVDFSNKTLVPDQTDFMIQQLEGKASLHLKRTYANGLPLEEVYSSAPTLTVGLKFLPGADKPQVTRIEQTDMEGKEADQKDPAWRVATAGALLSQFDVTPDFQITRTDQTATIVARAKHPARDRNRIFSELKKALNLRRRYPDTVTIDSERVAIVKDLRAGDWDLRGLLVEVDWSSLRHLMVDFRNLVAGGGPDMTFDETRNLLETTFEDARRLFIRSPILFRMSTRVSIINSENTRYGISNRDMFQTLTTSKDIKEIISLSAAYYNSLDPSGSDDLVQKYIRPRFLQMIVLLLSLLNNEDLAEIKDFLEATYKLKADRRDIELLILKVIPLSSINARVFLNALVHDVDGFPLQGTITSKDEDPSHIWDIFIKRILENGYLLPGTVNDLGRDGLSWIVKWPEDGFKSTAVFNTLQYSGRLRTINDIPSVEVHPGSNCTELTVVMTDESTYVISPGDLDNIGYMTPGAYPVRQTMGSKACLDLLIWETLLNGELNQAIKMTNEIVDRVNQGLANPKREGNVISRIVRPRPDHQPFLNDFRATGRLEKIVATLDRSTLAVTYRLEGRKVSQFDALQTMAQDIRHLRAFIDHIERRSDMADRSSFSAEKREFKQSLEKVKVQVNLAEQSWTRMGVDEELSNEPIKQCLYPKGTNLRKGDVWNAYEAWCQEHDRYLNVEATTSAISSVRWITGDVIELSLSQKPSRVFVTPLQRVPEGLRDDEARIGDIAILLGQYIAIGERVDSGHRPYEAYSLINYLRIVSMEEQSQSRRSMNRVESSMIKDAGPANDDLDHGYSVRENDFGVDLRSVLSNDKEGRTQISPQINMHQVIAEEHVGNLLAEHGMLRPLYFEALAKLRKGQFVRILRRNLKDFRVDLHNTQKTSFSVRLRIY